MGENNKINKTYDYNKNNKFDKYGKLRKIWHIARALIKISAPLFF